MLEWIKVYKRTFDDPKIKRLARQLQTEVPALVGHLVSLWCWVSDYAQDGDLTAFCAEDIAEGARWSGDPEVLIEALINCGDKKEPGIIISDAEGIRLYNWDVHTGREIEEQRKDRERKRQYREAKKEGKLRKQSTAEENAENTTCPADDRRTSVVDKNKNREEKTRLEEKRKEKNNIRPGQNSDSTTEKQTTQTAETQNAEQNADLILQSPEQNAAFKTITQMYEHLPKYKPHGPKELAFVIQAFRNFPEVNVNAEFSKALDWLSVQPPSKRTYKSVTLFLRRWLSTAQAEMIQAAPTETVFVPVEAESR